MASKRKRRRQAARRAAMRELKKDKENTVVASVAKVYKDYKVAVQKTPDDPMMVFTVREHDVNNLLPFIARIQEVNDVKDLAHLDVHLSLDDGRVQIIYESSDEWPKGVEVRYQQGFIVRGKDRALSVKTPKPVPAKPTTPAAAQALPAVAKEPPPPGVELIFMKRYVTKPIQLTT